MTAVWEAQTLRVTFFPTETVAVSSDWWLDFTGTQPESESKHPKDAIVVVSGAFERKFLLISSGVGRVDVVFQPVIPSQVDLSQPQSFPTITLGSGELLLNTLYDRIGPLCERIRSVDRIALGGTFLRLVSSRNEAYEQLKLLLKSVSVDPQGMRDVLYRVNWPVPDAKGRLINRIGVWGSILAKISAREPSLGDSNSSILSEDYYVSFEFDINTAPEAGVHFAPEEAKLELSFLRRLLEENLELGEVPSK